MIAPDASCTIRRIALDRIAVVEHQRRYWKRVRRYVRLLRRQPTHDAGFLLVAPDGERFVLLDGHHRYCALIIAGRRDALCVVIQEQAGE